MTKLRLADDDQVHAAGISRARIVSKLSFGHPFNKMASLTCGIAHVDQLVDKAFVQSL